MRKLILTADDFGISPAVNEAVEQAHRRGVLSAASLMVGAKWAQDAVDRARRLSSLRVGLHVVLVDGSPVLPRKAIPDLVGPKGEFSSDLFRAGFKYFFHPRVRRQLEKEIRAQFEAFQTTSLLLDHVNCHHHMHLHPTVSRILLKVGKEYGLRAMRLPFEPPLYSWRASRKGLLPRLAAAFFLAPWIVLLKERLRHAGIRSNQFMFGMNDSGRMDADLLGRILPNLPPGTTEICFHPAARRNSGIDRIAESRRCSEELKALTSPELLRSLALYRIERIAFTDL